MLSAVLKLVSVVPDSMVLAPITLGCKRCETVSQVPLPRQLEGDKFLSSMMTASIKTNNNYENNIVTALSITIDNFEIITPMIS